MESMRATWTDTRLDEFATRVDQRFDAVDKRFDAVDERLDRFDARFEAVDHRFGEVHGILAKLDVDLREMRTENSANSRALLQFCGVMVAAQMGTVAAMIALFA
jgi:hypothetical protein